MADPNQQNNNNDGNKQKGGNQQQKQGISLGTSYSAVNNSNLGETIRGALCDSFGYMMGAIFTGVASYGLNKIISKFKPNAYTPDVFPAKSEGPTPKEIMNQMHNLARTNPDEAQRILASVGSRFQTQNQNSNPAPVNNPPAVNPPKEVVPAAPKQDIPAPTSQAPKSKAKTTQPKEAAEKQA